MNVSLGSAVLNDFLVQSAADEGVTPGAEDFPLQDSMIIDVVAVVRAENFPLDATCASVDIACGRRRLLFVVV